jgi:oligoendopeptidase F
MLSLILGLLVFGGIDASAQSIRERSEIDDQYKWNLSDICPDWDAWEQGMVDLEQKMNEFKELEGTLSGGPENVARAYQLSDEMDIIAYKVYRYPQLHFSLNNRDNDAAGKLQRVTTLYAQFGIATAWFNPELLAIDWDTMSKWLDEYEGLVPFRFPIENAYRQQKHVLSEDKERLLSYYSLVNASPTESYNALSTADIQYRDITLADGTTTTLTEGSYRNILANNPNQADRAASMKVYYATYSDNANSYAALYNGVLQSDWANAQARNYNSCLEAGLDGYNVPVEVVENLIKSVRKGLGPLHRYHKIRKEALGLEEYHLYDQSFPIIDYNPTYEYDDVVDWIVNSVKPLGENYSNRVREGFKSRWVDVYETPNKSTGAYSANCYGVHPYILMNYNKTLSNVFTLAHEFGHALHTVLANENQPKATSQYTLLGAEVASAVNEGLLMDYMIKKTNDPLERIFLLLQAINDLEGVYYSQVQFAEYEVEAHRMVERGEPITAESLSELYSRIQREYSGDNVTSDSLYQYTWTRISHFYDVPYYVYQYAASFAVAAQIMDDLNSDDKSVRKDAINRYMTYLKAGGSDYPINLMRETGADLTDPTTFDAVTARLDHLVTLLEEEMAKL